MTLSAGFCLPAWLLIGVFLAACPAGSEEGSVGVTQPTDRSSQTAGETLPSRQPLDASRSQDATPASDTDAAQARRSVRHFPAAPVAERRMLRLLRTAPVKRMRPVGATSVVFQTALVGPVNAAFKLDSRERPRAVVSEVRAYRVARLLGLDNVPPVVVRRLPRATLQQRMHPAYMPAWAKIRHALRDRAEEPRVAAIYWVPGLKDMGVESRSGMRRWRPWLSGDAGVPEAQRSLAADLSRMLCFDYLVGNWDRLSGSNAKGLPSQGRLVLRDHDIALASELAAPLHERLWRRATTVERFSRNFVARLRRLTPDVLRRELARDAGLKASAADAAWVRGLMDRRQALLSHVNSLIGLHGEREVLVFD